MLEVRFHGKKSRIATIKNFLEARGGVEEFLWVAPSPYDQLRAWRFKKWDHAISDANDETISGVMEEVIVIIPRIDTPAFATALAMPVLTDWQDSNGYNPVWVDPASGSLLRRFYLSNSIAGTNKFYYRFLTGTTAASFDGETVTLSGGVSNGTLYSNPDTFLGTIAAYSAGTYTISSTFALKPGIVTGAGQWLRIGNSNTIIALTSSGSSSGPGPFTTAVVGTAWVNNAQSGSTPVGQNVYLVDIAGPNIPSTSNTINFAALLIKGFDSANLVAPSLEKRLIYKLH